ncbi:MAG: polysaccharide deacetylase family protein [Coriobacteriales bacterium]|nr:polysaccharide deacetylase family protein [Coriobacteriales bacterium]
MARKRNTHQGAHFAQPQSQSQSQFQQQAQPQPRRRRSKGPLVAILVVLVLAGLGVGGFFLYTRLPVSVSLGGQQRTVFKNSTVNDLFQAEKPQVQPGDYVSVTGEVLKADEGDPYSATVNGTQLTYEQAKSRTLLGNESITFSDGANVMEPHTSEVVDEQPKLEYRVANGTAEKGDHVQQGVVQYVQQWGKAGKREILHGQETGETAAGGSDQPAQNCVIVAQNIHPDNDQKLVALTFDDGPTYFTEPYLSILDEKDVKASFCVIGEQLADGGPVVAQVADAGHQILSHSWDHQQYTALDAEDVQAQLGDTSDALRDILGKDVMYARPPYGDIDEETWLKTGGLMSVSLYWTHDSLDWERPGADAIVQNCTIGMAPGSVILMHDGGGDRNQDLEALPRVIDAWKDAGYTFVTVEELLKSDSSIDLSAVGNGSAMPEDAAWPTELA